MLTESWILQAVRETGFPQSRAHSKITHGFSPPDFRPAVPWDCVPGGRWEEPGELSWVGQSERFGADGMRIRSMPSSRQAGYSLTVEWKRK